MTEQELRALVRDAIAKAGVGGAGRSEDRPLRPMPLTGHGSHALFVLPPGDPDGRCMIEPGVACNHCGYCKSYGH
jgi:hypothetical protein